MKTHSSRTIVGALSILLALIVAPISGTAMAANAPQSPIDSAKNGLTSLTIEKHIKTAADKDLKAADGAKLPDGTSAPGDVLPGVTFTIQKVTKIGSTDLTKLDLTTNAGWAVLAELIGTDGKPKGGAAVEYGNAYADAAAGEKATGDNGQVKFENLPFGLYYVQETKTPTTDKEGKTIGVTPAAPFYITLPQWIVNTAEAAGGHYIYDAFVYPKNTVDRIDKAVNDHPTTGTGSDITYTLTPTVRPYEAGITKYQITDSLDARLVLKDDAGTANKNEAVVITVTKANDAEQVPTLVEGVDYTVTVAPNAEKTRNELTIKFIKFDNLNKIAGVTRTLKVEIKATLDSKGDIKDITNDAVLVPNQDPKWNDDGVKSPTVKSKLGKIVLTKVAANDENKKLIGATFKLLDEDNNPVTFVDGEGKTVTEVTTGQDGVAIFSGLRVSNFDSMTTPDPITRVYKVVETKAPEGYGLLPEPIEVQVLLSDTDNGNGSQVAVTAKDPEKNITFKLPITGSMGVGTLIGAGVVLLVVGGLLIVVRRKRSAE
ncbi:MAG: SpaH/EbpB family LPXTG-anchored major pilin [Arcanobacterium sp.]|nr:SpaH/EbpB family LPXTG-anchored major pilin [Arcanobacterium sp.]MDY5588577.1 SpaH/EbpB family LPXTG-anchored major pilin [Arcanobacterium sp.]